MVSSNNASKQQMGFNSAFKGLIPQAAAGLEATPSMKQTQ